MKKFALLVPACALALAACGGDDKPTPVSEDQKAREECTKVVAERQATPDVKQYPVTDDPNMSDAVIKNHKTGNAVTYESARFTGRYRDDLTKHPGCKPRTATPVSLAADGGDVAFPIKDGKYQNKDLLNSKNEAALVPGIPVQNTDASKPGYLKDYPCAAKLYDFPAGVTEDTTKPIIVLIHGNSSHPDSWEEWFVAATAGTKLTQSSGFNFNADTTLRKQLATRLIEAGFKTYAYDARVDRIPYLPDATPVADGKSPGFGDGFENYDHGWAVPLAQALVRAIMTANPDRKVVMIGHSLGSGIALDIARRLYLEFKGGKLSYNPLSRISGMVLASGALHGVVGGSFACGLYETMRGSVNCELGDRDKYVKTDYHRRTIGPNDLYAVPCADGSYAYGDKDACQGNFIRYMTLTMQDPPLAKPQDEFINEASARINMDRVELKDDGTRKIENKACVDNALVGLGDYDTSGFFITMTGLQGFLANHFGSIRSDNGMTKVMDFLAIK